MSIFKEPLKEPVKAQLKARQDAIGGRTTEAIRYLNSRVAWVRMTSAVDIEGSGGTLAKQNVLLGGALYNNTSQRAGVGVDASHAYSLNTTSGVQHRLGIRPMPGITGIDIKSKSAYGSLREVTVNFQCWDIHQLEDLELLYMRQGFTALIEWGWMPYLGNDGKVQNNILFTNDVLNGGKTKEQIWKIIWDKSMSSGGNYEGMYGTIKNYSWSARADGGYDCSTTIITMGELVESLKVNYTRSDTKVASNGLFNIIDKSLFEPDKPVNKSYSQCFLAGMVDEIYRSVTEKGYTTKTTTNLSLTTTKGSVACDFFMLDIEKADSSAGTDDKNKDSFVNNKEQIYIRLKDFIALFNVNVTLQDEQGNSPITAVSVTEGFHQSTPDKDLLCLGNDYQISTDPTVCQIGNPLYENPAGTLGFESNDGLQNAIDIVKALTTNKYYDQATTFGTIGNIYVNLAYIYGLVVNDDLSSQDKKEKKEISVYDFFKNMMTGINTAIGNVANFDIHVDPTDSIARIIDINYVDEQNQKDAYNNAFTLEVHNTSSTVRSYKFESSIFPEMSATVAIGAQVKGGAQGTGNNTLVDFNKGLKDRIIPKKAAPEIQSSPNDDTEKIKNVKTSMQTIAKYFSNLEKSGGFLGFFESGGFDVNEVSTYAGALRDIIVYYQTTAKDNSNNRSIIPTKFSCEMDGIGGLIIGNMFKIPSDLSPKGYKGESVGIKIGYVVTGLAHSVQNNDWVTKIDAQYIIMDESRGLDPAFVRAIIAEKLKETTEETETPNTETPQETKVDLSNLPPAKTGDVNAMIKATNAVFRGGHGVSGMCAWYTYNIARDYVAAVKGKPTRGLVDSAGGNANQAAYRKRLQALGYTMTFVGNISRNDLVKLINGDWGYGDIINYRDASGTNPRDGSKQQYGHTQIFTNGVQQNGNKVRFTSSVPANYGTSLVYRGNGPWETYVFRAPGNSPTPSTPSTPTIDFNATRIANQLFKAMDGCGTDEANIRAQFNQLRNQKDWVDVFNAYGTKEITCALGKNYTGNLKGALASELSSSNLADLKNILKQKGITW